MIDAHLEGILWVTGAITMLPLLQFLAPRLGLKLLYKVEVNDPVGLLFARHWGLLAFVLGALLFYAAGHPEIRRPVLFAAMVEKAGLVGLLAAQRKAPSAGGLRLTLAFDALCSLLYAGWLLGI